MAVPIFRRFNIQDVPGSPSWVEGIFQPLNTFCDSTVNIMNGNLAFGENVQGQKYTVKFITPSDYATGGFTTIQLPYSSNGRPNCLMLGSINTTDGTIITNATSISSWFLNNNQTPALINILYVSGLAADTNYIMTAIAL